MSRVATATISLNALRHNLSIVRELVPQSKILAVIKADAYGHGLLTVAKALNEADGFAVAHFEEAVTIRQQHKDKLIVLLQGFADEIELVLLLSQYVEPVIHSLYQIDILEKVSLPKATPVWLKLDTGMNRLGINLDDFDQVWARLNEIPEIKGNIKIMSHFANADDLDSTSTMDQLALYKSKVSHLSVPKSVANSAGILAWPESYFDWVRPGVMLYGVSPFPGKKGSDHGLQLVMTLKSRIIAINKIKKSQAVGYGSCWRAEQDTSIAVIGCGYGDGYPRHVAEHTPVMINNKTYPIVGRVSMDMICVNLGESHSIQVGEEAILWGDGLAVEHIAEKANTIAYELLCQVTSRVKLIEVDHG